MAQILYLPKAVPLSSTGGLLAGAKLYTYLTDTSTPQRTFQDNELTVSHANPIVADAYGVFPVIYLASSNDTYDNGSSVELFGLYRVTLKTSADVTLYTADDLGPPTATSLSVPSLAGANVYTGTNKFQGAEVRVLLDETDGGSDKRLWEINVNAGVLKFRTRTDADGTGVDFLTATRGTGTAITSVVFGGGTGSFTGTLTGYAASLTPTIEYRKTGSWVTLTCNAGSIGTSNANTMTLTGLPALCIPLQSQNVICRLQDNTVNGFGIAGVAAASGTITFGNGITGTVFTTSGSKGLPGGWTLSYETA